MKLSAVVADPWAYIRRARPEAPPASAFHNRFEFIDSLPEPYGPDPVVFGPRTSSPGGGDDDR